MTQPYVQYAPGQIRKLIDLSVARTNVQLLPSGIDVAQLVVVIMPPGGAATVGFGADPTQVSLTPNLLRNFFGGFSGGFYITNPASAIGGNMELLFVLNQDSR